MFFVSKDLFSSLEKRILCISFKDFRSHDHIVPKFLPPSTLMKQQQQNCLFIATTTRYLLTWLYTNYHCTSEIKRLLLDKMFQQITSKNLPYFWNIRSVITNLGFFCAEIFSFFIWFLNYGNFWRVSVNHFIKHKLLNFWKVM